MHLASLFQEGYSFQNSPRCLRQPRCHPTPIHLHNAVFPCPQLHPTDCPSTPLQAPTPTVYPIFAQAQIVSALSALVPLFYRFLFLLLLLSPFSAFASGNSYGLDSQFTSFRLLRAPNARRGAPSRPRIRRSQGGRAPRRTPQTAERSHSLASFELVGACPPNGWTVSLDMRPPSLFAVNI